MQNLLKTHDTNVLHENTYQKQPISYQNYHSLIQSGSAYFKRKIKHIHDKANINTPPVSFEHLEDYFSGFVFEYQPFENAEVSCLWGMWDMMPDKDNKVTIYYALSGNECRDRFSIAHELMHYYQYLDTTFKHSLQEKVPEDVAERIIEKLADQMAAYYLVPPEMLYKTYRDNPSAHYQAQLYHVSPQVIEICLTNYGIIQ